MKLHRRKMPDDPKGIVVCAEQSRCGAATQCGLSTLIFREKGDRHPPPEEETVMKVVLLQDAAFLPALRRRCRDSLISSVPLTEWQVGGTLAEGRRRSLGLRVLFAPGATIQR